MANGRLSDIIREISFLQAGGDQRGRQQEAIGQVNQFANTIIGATDLIRRTADSKLRRKAAERKLQPATTIDAPRVQAALDAGTFLDREANQRRASEIALASEQKFGGMTIGEAEAAGLFKPEKIEETKTLFIDPRSRNIRTTPAPGYVEVSRNTAATIAAGPARERSQAELRLEVDARKKLNEFSGSAVKSFDALDKLDKAAKELGDFERGLGSQLGAKVSLKARELAADPKVTRYLGVVNQELIPLARNLAEEKGPITNTDVDRIQKGLGNTSVPLIDKLFLSSELRKKVVATIRDKMQIAGITDLELSQSKPQLFRRLMDAEASIVLIDEEIAQIQEQQGSNIGGSGLTPEQRRAEIEQLKRELGE